MDFDWRDYLIVAEDLLTSTGEHERAYLRTVAGRTYYASYGRLRWRIESVIAGDSKLRHSEVVSGGMKNITNDADICRLYQRMKANYAMRIRADYQCPVASDITGIDAETSLDTAREATEIIDKLTDPQLQRIYNVVLTERRKKKKKKKCPRCGF